MRVVVLLHGLGRGPAAMRPLERRLRAAGFGTSNLGYPSRSGDTDALIARLAPQMPVAGQVDFVGHSLGGVLAKHLARRLPAKRRGRIVQIGAPNAGSELAARMAPLAPVLGPVLEELEPKPAPDDSDLEIGAIAGTAAWPIYGVLTGIEGANDGKVSLESAWGDLPPDRRIRFPVAHSLMMFDDRVLRATVRFLVAGRF
ncbi:MAG: hypothetical protein AAGE76_03095 [Pseudomonadota bacterium]